MSSSIAISSSAASISTPDAFMFSTSAPLTPPQYHALVPSMPLVPTPKPSSSTSNKPKLVLLQCGSFSPIHQQHLRNFEDAKNSMSKEFHVIQGIISPVHDGYGKKNLAPIHHRFAMCSAAVADSNWLTVGTWEGRQEGWSRTAITLAAYHEAVNNHFGNPTPPVQVRLLCGADLLQTFLVPNLWSPEHIDIILGKYGVVVIPRAGVDLNQLIDGNECIARHKDNIRIAEEAVGFPVSSTLIRTLVGAGQSAKYLLPDRVLEYVLHYRLWNAKLPEDC